MTLSWNVVGVGVLAAAALSARSVALAGFGVDSVIEIGASSVVLWELADVARDRRRRALRFIGVAFVVLAVYLTLQSTLDLALRMHPHHSPAGIAWTAVTVLVMMTLAAGKTQTGQSLNNPVLIAEGRVTMIDGILAGVVLIGLLMNFLANWWWADPVAGYVIVYYALREARTTLTH